jgi:hypothetical protein
MTEERLTPGYGRLEITIGEPVLHYLAEEAGARRQPVAEVVSDAVVLYQVVVDTFQRGGQVQVVIGGRTALLSPYEEFQV